MTIRPVLPNEAAPLHALAYHTFVEAFGHLNTPGNMALYLAEYLTLESTTQELANPNSRFFFGEVEGEPVAYLKVNQGSAQSEQPFACALEVQRIYVHANWQGQKLGAQLLAFARGLAQAEGFEHLWLGVWEENTAAIRFYQREGFTIFSQHDFYLGEELQTDIMLKYSF